MPRRHPYEEIVAQVTGLNLRQQREAIGVLGRNLRGVTQETVDMSLGRALEIICHERLAKLYLRALAQTMLDVKARQRKRKKSKKRR